MTAQNIKLTGIALAVVAAGFLAVFLYLEQRASAAGIVAQVIDGNGLQIQDALGSTLTLTSQRILSEFNDTNGSINAKQQQTELWIEDLVQYMNGGVIQVTATVNTSGVLTDIEYTE